MSNGRSFTESQSYFVRAKYPRSHFVQQGCGIVIFCYDNDFLVRIPDLRGTARTVWETFGPILEVQAAERRHLEGILLERLSRRRAAEFFQSSEAMIAV